MFAEEVWVKADSDLDELTCRTPQTRQSPHSPRIHSTCSTSYATCQQWPWPRPLSQLSPRYPSRKISQRPRGGGRLRTSRAPGTHQLFRILSSLNLGTDVPTHLVVDGRGLDPCHSAQPGITFPSTRRGGLPSRDHPSSAHHCNHRASGSTLKGHYSWPSAGPWEDFPIDGASVPGSSCMCRLHTYPGRGCAFPVDSSSSPFRWCSFSA